MVEIKTSLTEKVFLDTSTAGLEEELRKTLKTLSDLKYALDESAILAVIDQTGKITYVNDKFCEISKYSREELVGEDHRIFNSGYHPKKFIRNLWTTIASGKIWRGELRNQAKDGSIYWVDTTLVPLLDERGKPYQYADICYDITSRKKLEANLQTNIEELRSAEEELRAQNEELVSSSRIIETERERYQELFQFAPGGYLITDERGVVEEANLAAQELLGFNAKYLSGRPLVGIVAPKSRKILRNLLLPFEPGEGARTAEMSVTSGKKNFVAAVSVAPVIAPSGKVEGLRWLMRDISVRKQQEEKLRESEDRFRATFENAAVGIAHVALDGNWLRANQKLCEITGYSHEELIARNFQSITHPDDLPGDIALVGQLLSGKINTYSLRKRYIRKDKSIVWINLTSSLVRKESGEPNYFIAVVEDITEQIRAEERLRRSEENLRLATGAAEMYSWELDLVRQTTAFGENFSRVIGLKAPIAEMDAEKTFQELIHPEDANKVRKYIEGVIAGTGVATSQMRLVNPETGVVVWVEASSYAIRDLSGNPVRLVGVSQNITDRKRAEEALRESEERFRQLADNAPVLIWLNDAEGCYYVNRQYLDFLGVNKTEDARGIDWAKFVHPDDRDSYVSGYLRAFERRGKFFAQFRFRRGDGEYRWMISTGLPRFTGAGEFLGYVGSTIDIHDLKHAEELLRENEERYRLLFEESPLPAWVFDAETLQILAVNQTAVNHYGYSREDFLAMTARDLRPPGEIPSFLEAMRSLDNHDGKLTFQTRHLKKNGELIDVEISYDNINFENRPARFAVVQDLSERKLAEERIRQQASLLDQTKEAILVCDLDFQILYWNKGAEAVYGWRSDEILGKEIGFVLCAGDDSQRIAAEEALAMSEDFRTEVGQVTRDGRQITVESHWRLVRGAQGQPDYYLVVNSDITEQKKAEEQFLRGQRMESIGTLAGGIAHDLNNILAPILMQTELLGLEISDRGMLDQLSIIKENAERGADLIRQILVFARGAEGERVVVSLKQIVEDLVNILKQTFPKTIKIKYKIEPDIWSISADPTQIHQVLMNLAVNARDVMMAGGGMLTITAENILIDETYARGTPAAKPGCFVLLTVADTGEGMSPEVRKRIFDPFFTTKETGKGTGLGLSTALSIVRSHKGFINVYSEPRKGAKFSVYLPAMETEETAAEATSSTASFPRGGGELILVVDDEDNVLNVTRETLEKFGYRTLTARDGTEAIALFAENRDRVRLVLTDLAMPNLDGANEIRVLRKLNPEVRVIATSGLTSPDKSAQLESLKVNAFLAKPFTIEKLLRTLAEVLKKT